MKRSSGLFKIGFKLTLMVVSIVVVTTAAIAIFSYINFRDASVRLMSQNLIAVSRSAATLIEPDQYREIMASGVPNEYHYWLSVYFTNKVENHDIFFLHAGEIDPELGFTGFVQAQMHDFPTGLGEVTPPYQFPAEAFYAMAHGTYYLTDTFVALEYGWDIAGALLLVAYAPVIDDYGNTIAIVSAIDIDTSVYAHSREFITRLIGMSLLSMLILSVVPIIFARRQIAAPISRLSAAAEDIVNGDLSGDLSRETKIFSKDELGDLAENFIAMQASIRDKAEAELAAHQSELAKGRAEAVANVMRESADYARKIQINLIPSDDQMRAAFFDYSVIWKPRDIVGGDIHWMKQFDTGIALYAADCTGHGTPGALLTMLVVSALETIVTPDNCNDTADVIFQLDQRLASILNVNPEFDLSNINDGCDIVAIFIAKDGSVTFSLGNTSFFVCDGNETKRFRGKNVLVGEGKLGSKDDVKTFSIPASPNNKYYIVSDGLYEQPGGEHGRTYGLKEFSQILVDYHSEKQDVILDRVWKAFEDYRGDEAMVDDFALLSFVPLVESL